MGVENKVTQLLIYLMRCAVKEEKANLPSDFDEMEDALYKEADRHLVSAMIAYAIEAAGHANARSKDVIHHSLSTTMIMDYERNRVKAEFEKAHVWYMPLKGSILKDYYPRSGMRQMGDCDVLFDEQRADDVRKIMENLGYQVLEFGVHHHDAYKKEPVAMFEMHRWTFPKSHDMHAYYKDVKRKLQKDPDNQYGYHFRTEDAYVYLVAHEYTHYALYNGTGIRSIADTMVFLNKFGSQMNMEYVAGECKKLGISEFEIRNRNLAMHLFEDKPLDEKDEETLRYFADAGVYGNKVNRVQYKMNEFGGGFWGKVRFIWYRLFPGMSWVKRNHPFIYKHKVLLFLIPFFRMKQALTKRKKLALFELKALKAKGKAKE